MWVRRGLRIGALGLLFGLILPIFRDITLRVHEGGFAGPAPTLPREMEARIDRFIESTRNANGDASRDHRP